MLTQGMLAAARHQDQQAETLFRAVQNDSSKPHHDAVGRRRLSWPSYLSGKARREKRSETYKATLADFESARAQLKNEDSRLPFAANATGIYDDYIHLLVEQGRGDEALAAADQSRARTLAQGLGVAESKASFRPAALNPRQIAQKTGATLLFYWLGEPAVLPLGHHAGEDRAHPAARAEGDCGARRALPQGAAGCGRPAARPQ